MSDVVFPRFSRLFCFFGYGIVWEIKFMFVWMIKSLFWQSKTLWSTFFVLIQTYFEKTVKPSFIRFHARHVSYVSNSVNPGIVQCVPDTKNDRFHYVFHQNSRYIYAWHRLLWYFKYICIKKYICLQYFECIYLPGRSMFEVF